MPERKAKNVPENVVESEITYPIISSDNALIVIVAILVINNTYHNDYKRNRVGYPHHNRI